MNRRILVVLFVVAAAAVVYQVSFRGGSEQGPAVADTELGLRKTALDDDQAPPAFVFTDASPGDNPLIERAYVGAPPRVPHSLDGFVPITADDNTCLLCHQTGSNEPEDPPQVPVSHLRDLRRAPDVERETVAGARWNCMACHVLKSNAPDLVENAFTGRRRQP